MSDNINFISTGNADVHIEYLDIRQISELGDESVTASTDYVIHTLTQIMYGISQERVIVIRTNNQARVLDGHKFISAIRMLTSTSSIYFDSWNGRFLDRTSGKYCLPAQMLISPIESTKFREAVSKLCPDKPDSICDAIFNNLSNCNTALSLFRHPVCYIDSDEKLISLFSGLFNNNS